jgi:hypothetical protein
MRRRSIANPSRHEPLLGRRPAHQLPASASGLLPRTPELLVERSNSIVRGPGQSHDGRDEIARGEAPTGADPDDATISGCHVILQGRGAISPMVAHRLCVPEAPPTKRPPVPLPLSPGRTRGLAHGFKIAVALPIDQGGIIGWRDRARRQRGDSPHDRKPRPERSPAVRGDPRRRGRSNLVARHRGQPRLPLRSHARCGRSRCWWMRGTSRLS